MDKVFLKIVENSGAFLRYIAPGFVFLYVVLLTGHDPLVGMFSEVSETFREGSYVLFGVLCGVSIYSFHHNTMDNIWWFVFAYLHRSWAGKHINQDKSFKGSGELKTELLIARWRRGGNADPIVVAISQKMEAWGHLVAYLYCVSYPIILAYPLGSNWVFLPLGIIMYLGAMFGQIKILRMEVVIIRDLSEARKLNTESNN